MLEEFNIEYLHVTGLAPTPQLKSIQMKADMKKGVTAKGRETLTTEFTTKFNAQILDKFDFKRFITSLEKDNRKNVVFFCVESHPGACHRSLVSARLTKVFGLRVKHIL